MNTIEEKIQIIADATSNIKEEIIANGGTITGDITTWSEVINNMAKNAPGKTFKITNKLNNYLFGGPTYSTTGELLHTYNFSGGNLSSCAILPVLDDETVPNVQHPGSSEGAFSSQIDGFILLHDVGFKYGNFNLKVANLTTSTCEVIVSGGNSQYPTEKPLLVYFICINTDGEYDVDTFYMQSGGPCFVKNTLITLSDNTTKLVQDINYNDELLVWNFDDGKYDSAKPCWIKKEEKTTYYYKVSLDNGTIIKLVGSNGKCHRLFSIEDGMFISATDMVGKTTYTQNGESKVISCELIQEECVYYNIITEKHINLFANNILTSCRYNNIYPIENMKFIKDNRLNRAPKWKLYEQFRDYKCLYRYIDGLRLYEQLDIPLEETIKYCENLERLRKKLDEFEENKEIINKIEDTEVGWIDRVGNAYGFKAYMPGQYNHIILADKICETLGIETNNTSRELEKMGWLKYTTDFVLNSNDMQINNAQLNTLRTFLNVPNKLKTNGKIRIGSFISPQIDVSEFDSMDIYSFEYRKIQGLQIY
jgi:hypothetical protein